MPSNFESLPLPVTKDSQDYARLIPAGQTVEIPVVGDFIYCKFSDGEIRVVINGKSTNMESGDERRSGDGTVFRGVNLINDTGVDKSVIFVIGFGGFNRRIIRGEVSVVPQIRKADGSLVDDTRTSVTGSISYPQNSFVLERFAGDVIRRVDYERIPNVRLCQGPGNTLVGEINRGEFYQIDIGGNVQQIGQGNPSITNPAGDLLTSDAFYFSKFRNGYFSIGKNYTTSRHCLLQIAFTSASTAPVVTFIKDITGPLAAFGEDIDKPESVSELENGKILYVDSDEDSLYLLNNDFSVEQRQVFNSGVPKEVIGFKNKVFVTGLFNGADLEERSVSDLSHTIQRIDLQSVETVGAGAFGNLLVIYKGGSNSDSFILVEPFSAFTAEYSFDVTTVGCLAGFQKPEVNTTDRIYIEMTRQADGRYKGPVIKLVLTKLFGEIPENYLDSVFGLSIQPDNTQVGTGLSSFAAIGIIDDFIVSNGATITIQHDASLLGF
jgi:hypothetical protein